MNFRISIAQQPLAWHDRAANLAHFDAVLKPLAGTTDLIVLPEMFTSGFTMNAEKHAEAADGPTRAWLLGSRRRPELEYDIAIFVENLAFVVGVNRVGEDGGGHVYVGDSAVLDYMGQPVVELTDKPQVVTAPIDLEALRMWRDRFPAHLDADAFSLE